MLLVSSVPSGESEFSLGPLLSRHSDREIDQRRVWEQLFGAED